MTKKSKKIIIWTLVSFLILGVTGVCFIYYNLFSPKFHPDKTTYIFIDRDYTADSVLHKVEINGKPQSMTGFINIS